MGLSRAEALRFSLFFSQFLVPAVSGMLCSCTQEELLSAPTLTLANAFGSLVGGAKSCKPGLGVPVPLDVCFTLPLTGKTTEMSPGGDRLSHGTEDLAQFPLGFLLSTICFHVFRWLCDKPCMNFDTFPSI